MEFASATIHKAGNQLHVSHGDDKGLYVEFYTEAVKSPFKSEEAGRPIFEDKPYVRILFPGDTTKRVERPVDLHGSETKPSDPQRWPQQWAAYQNQQEQVQVGTPIIEWPAVSKSQALNLKAMNVHTVEGLAEMADSGLNWLGARELREKARAYLAAAAGGAELSRAQAENAALRADIEALKAQFAELAESNKSTRRKGAEVLA